MKRIITASVVAIVAGTAAGCSSAGSPSPGQGGASPAGQEAPASVGSGDCLLGANGADVEVGIGNPTVPCAQWITNLAGDGLVWYSIGQMALPGLAGGADQETMGVACDLTDGTQELYVEDAGGMSYGTASAQGRSRTGGRPKARQVPSPSWPSSRPSSKPRRRPPRLQQHRQRARRPRRSSRRRAT